MSTLHQFIDLYVVSDLNILLNRIDISVKGRYHCRGYFSLGPPEVIDENNYEGLQ